MYRALSGMYQALLGVRSLLGVYRALLGVCYVFGGISRTLLGSVGCM